MKLRVLFDITLDEEGIEDYYKKYPEFKAVDATVTDTLVREAVAQWKIDGLITSANGWVEWLPIE